jgi:hypothetical protein
VLIRKIRLCGNCARFEPDAKETCRDVWFGHCAANRMIRTAKQKVREFCPDYMEVGKK